MDYLKLKKPRLRRPCLVGVRIYPVKILHTLDTGKTYVQVLPPRSRDDPRPNSIPVNGKAKKERHVLQSRCHLPAWEVKRVRLRPPSIDKGRQQGPVKLDPMVPNTLNKSAESKKTCGTEPET